MKQQRVPDPAPVPLPPDGPAPSRARYRILAVLFLITTLNYADRATLSIVGTDISASSRE